jgi:hypothetical protein
MAQEIDDKPIKVKHGDRGGRMLSPMAQMSRALRRRDVASYTWACLAIFAEELRQKTKASDRTFSGRDVKEFLDQISKGEREKREIESQALPPTTKGELDDWVGNTSPSSMGGSPDDKKV